MTARLLLILLGGCALAGPVVAGSLDAPAAPNDPNSAMYTLQSLCDRLDTGAAGAKRGAPFAEPTTGPGATMCTLNDIMAKMPIRDDPNGATAAEVLSGKAFWGLTDGAWGTRSGTMPNIGAQNITPGTSSQTISAGYHNGAGQVAGDADLTAANIKSGVSIFGVAGTYAGSGGTTPAPFPVAKTGQTTSYASGDDGALQKGAAWPSPRFTDNSNGTVTDNLTGLVWLKNASCSGGMTWAAAMGWATALESGPFSWSCGLTDGSVAG